MGARTVCERLDEKHDLTLVIRIIIVEMFDMYKGNSGKASTLAYGLFVDPQMGGCRRGSTVDPPSHRHGSSSINHELHFIPLCVDICLPLSATLEGVIGGLYEKVAASGIYSS